MAQKYSHEQIMAMSPEEKEALKQQLLAEKARMSQAPQASPYAQARPTLGQSLGRSLLMGTQAYTTGQIPKEAYESLSPATSAEPDWYAKQQFEQEQAKEMEKYKAELKPRGTSFKNIGGTLVAIDQDTGDVTEVFKTPPKEKRPQDIKAEMDIADRERANTLSSQSIKTSAQDTIDTIGEVRKGLTMPTGFGFFGDFPSIPGTKRATWETYVNKLLSTKIVNLMNEMKNASKTGATGFGQLNEKELAVLTNAATALKKTLPAEDAARILDELEAIAGKVLSGERGVYGAGGVSPQAQPDTDNDPLGLR